MTRRYVNQIANGDGVDEAYLVADKQLRSNRQGSLYLHLELRDKTGVIGARLWNATEALAGTFEAGDYLHARGKTQLFQGALQVILSHIEVIDPARLEPEEFMPQASQNVARLTKRLRDMLFGLNDPHLRALAECFLIDDEFLRKYTSAPAGIKNHHAYNAGLLEHVVTMMTAAGRIADLYPDVDKDLLLTGVFLHDVGKIDELGYDRTFSYTDRGQLVGHLIMGVVLLREKAAKVPDLTGEPFPDELLMRLEHMIVSHHGAHEFGSPKLPMTPEAVALHYLDNLDAKLHQVGREIRDDPNRDSSWTPFHQSLGRRIFKGTPGARAQSDGEASE
ncbi:HD domain-containing protein [Isosphaeraceae bacterium EP7]